MSTLDKFETIKDTYMFCRQLCFKLLYDQPHILQDLAKEDRGLFQDLVELLQESGNFTGVFKKRLDRLLQTGRDMQILSKKEFEFLRVDHAVIPTFYLLPKIHKRLTKPPGRPIVAGIGGLDVLVVTCDVESLYSNIRHTDGITAIKYFLEKSDPQDMMHSSFLSFHPEHLRKGIPKGQFLRVRRNCSDDNDFKTEAADLTRRFQARGYPRKIISQAFCVAKNTPRQDLLQPKMRQRDTENLQCNLWNPMPMSENLRGTNLTGIKETHPAALLQYILSQKGQSTGQDPNNGGFPLPDTSWRFFILYGANLTNYVLSCLARLNADHRTNEILGSTDVPLRYFIYILNIHP